MAIVEYLLPLAIVVTSWADAEAVEENMGSWGEVFFDELAEEEPVAFFCLFGDTIFSMSPVIVMLWPSSSSQSSKVLSVLSGSSSLTLSCLSCSMDVLFSLKERSSLFRFTSVFDCLGLIAAAAVAATRDGLLLSKEKFNYLMHYQLFLC